MADETDPLLTENGNGQPRLIIQIMLWSFLGIALLIFSSVIAYIGVTSMWQAALDAQGVNAVRGDSKDVIIFIIGAMAGAVTARATSTK